MLFRTKGRAELPGLRTGSVALQPPFAPSAPLAHEPGMELELSEVFLGTSIVIQCYSTSFWKNRSKKLWFIVIIH